MTSAKLRRLGRFALAASFALARPGGKRFRRDGVHQSLVAQNRRADRLGGFLQQRHRRIQEDPPRRRHRLEQFPNEAYKTTIQVALVGSDPPDIFFNWSGEDAARLARDGLALDITELGKGEGGFENTLSQGWLSSFQSDGKYYGAPTDAVSKYFYYNKKFFAEHNLQPPADFDGCSGSARRSARSTRTSCRCRSAIPSAGSSTTTSRC